MGDAPRPDEGDVSETKAAKPIDRADIERRQKRHSIRAAGYADAARFLSDQKEGDHRHSVMLLKAAARMSRDFESELGVILGELPF
jgi:hypothetical protein